MRKPLTLGQIWTAPAMLGLISVVGLVSALFYDGIGDAVSWLSLSVPVTVALCRASR